MKKIYFSLVAIFAMAFMSVNAQVIFTENFDYADASLLSANGWNPQGQTPSTVNPIATSGNWASLTNTGQDLFKNFDVAAITSGSIYASFLVNVSDAGLAGDYFLHFSETPVLSRYSGRVFVKKDANNKLAFGISKAAKTETTAPNAVVYSSFDYDLNTSYRIVLKYTFVDGTANDIASLFVSPAGQTEPTATIVSVDQGTNMDNPANIGAISLRQGAATITGLGTAAATLKIDEIKVGKSWNDVVVTGIFNTASKSNAYVFPNPVKNVLTVKNAQNVNRVEISNIIGEKLISETLNNNSVDVSSLFNGIYFVTLFNDNQAVKTVKFIKE